MNDDAKRLFEVGVPNAAGYRDVTAAHVAAATARGAGNLRLVDVREPSELAAELGHVRGIDPVPLATIETAARRWSKEEPIVLVCRSGARSGRAAAALAALGFRHVMNVAGGMVAWNAAGLPTERTLP